MKKLTLFNKILFIINTVFAIGLVVSFALPYLEPQTYGVVALMSLVVPVFILINAFFVVYWILIGFKKQFLQSLIVLIFSYFFQPSIYKFNPTTSTSKNGITVFSYNVRKFNKYNWLKDKDIDKKIDSFITSLHPDIVAIQEYRKLNNFNLNYPFNYNHIIRNNQSGLVIYSKYPIIKKGYLEYKRSDSRTIFVDIVKGTDTLRVYNFHLASLGVNPEKDYLEANESKKLIKRLNRSFKIQQDQIDTLQKHLKTSKYKKILVGDMNNTSHSWAYKNIKGGFTDTFLEAGKGFGRTFNFNNIPLRIDYILVDEGIKVNNHTVFDVKLSDHQPIIAEIEL
ncbi:MAG: endonuclease/exonuclease/phosphatase family protein [Flavobacteriaceae bacterium]|nr:endonuclease/exonuclease/phosphatase family protein [Flavobacteriaceae bacterium]MCB0485769.1 endonuclease/exonuclease/phosphatase family protein [Flavobacteriaceae bacterium]